MDEGIMQNSATREDGMGPGMMGENGMIDDGGMVSEEMRKAMMSKGMGPKMMQDMQVIHSQLMQHIKR